ncbi:hypothetical protein LV457_02685 [Mycobacterium sp. MYCO198283]|uniref:hypothetical protein n=1 Tax=Mycobacterium sp. MYCO198283 TaxID=2883505 RepID=UPI001E343B5C|nr:hypothetical protein [Mycobacterium sp. MYCO198283]MCG5431196.1 hypothetical protein [Mycobacterium sp. MYCO198283]
MPAPGYVLRACPVCKAAVDTVRQPGRGRELVWYADHLDGVQRFCPMSGRGAALAAVAFTGITGAAA